MEVAGTSATGLIALLEEPSADLQAVALQRIAPIVDQLWYQVAGAVSALEALHENEAFAERELAALVVSKVRETSTRRIEGKERSTRKRGHVDGNERERNHPTPRTERSRRRKHRSNARRRKEKPC